MQQRRMWWRWPSGARMSSAAGAAGVAVVVLATAALRVDGAGPPDEPAFEPGVTYVERLPESSVSFEMVAVPGGTFVMGSAEDDPDRRADEGPQIEVELAPFWMATHEVTWDEYDEFGFSRATGGPRAGDADADGADAVTRPSRPYMDESRGFGKGRQPAMGMTHHAAMEYCRWLSQVTGRTYRLPTEAEWEYAARAGETVSRPDDLDAHAWFADNARARPHPAGGKAPNAWGLHDMLGNVAELVLDQYAADRYETLSVLSPPVERPVVVPDDRRYPHVVRGGSYRDGREALRYPAREASSDAWSAGDPQIPQSIWWHSDQGFVGFRVVRAVDEQPELSGLRSQVTVDSF